MERERERPELAGERVRCCLKTHKMTMSEQVTILLHALLKLSGKLRS